MILLLLFYSSWSKKCLFLQMIQAIQVLRFHLLELEKVRTRPSVSVTSDLIDQTPSWQPAADQYEVMRLMLTWILKEKHCDRVEMFYILFYFRSTSSAITSAIDTSAVWRGRCRSIWWLTTETGTSRTARTSSGRQGTTWIRWARWHAVTGASPGRRWNRLMTTRIEPLGSGERCRSGAHGFRGGFLRSRQHVSDTRARTKWPPLGSCMCRLADGHTIRTRRLVVA